MKDHFIDTDEIPYYGAHFISSANENLSIHPTMMQELVDNETQLQAKVSDLLARTRDTRATSQTSITGRRSIVDQNRDALLELYETLWPMRNKGTFELTRFFPTGKKADIKRSIADVLSLVRNVNTAFAYQNYASIPNTSDLQAQLKDLEAKLSTQVSQATSAETVKENTTGEWQALREDWQRNYLGTQFIARGLYVRAGRGDDWKKLFKDFDGQAGSGGTGQTTGTTTGGSANQGDNAGAVTTG